MCANIKTLFNFDPPASEDEIYASCLQFVRKISGMQKPSRVNQAVFERAVNETQQTIYRLLQQLQTASAPRNREHEQRKARARHAKRLAG